MSVHIAGKAATPLGTFQHVQTRNLAVLEEAVRRNFSGVSLEAVRDSDRLDAIACRCDLQDTGLTYSRQGAEIRIRIPTLDVYAMLFSFKGGARATTGRADVDISGKSALIASAGQPIQLNYGADFEQLHLSVKPAALRRKLEALLDEPLRDQLVFAPATSFERSNVDSLRRQFMFMVSELDSRRSKLHPLTLAEFEQAVLVSFLTANDNNYTLALNRKVPSAAPRQVRRAEAYIESNWGQSLTIETLALASGVSVRSLFHAFQRSRGYSPMDFVKRIRLEQARKMLEARDKSTSVTTVAFACGFGNLGHFAGYYRRAFGEAPSATLRRTHRAIGSG
jgi:AraC-like DNA-binding protein